MPSRFLPMMASSVDSTMEANSARRCSEEASKVMRLPMALFELVFSSEIKMHNFASRTISRKSNDLRIDLPETACGPGHPVYDRQTRVELRCSPSVGQEFCLMHTV